MYYAAVGTTLQIAGTSENTQDNNDDIISAMISFTLYYKAITQLCYVQVDIMDMTP